jgi:ATP phosphoribosyltransferase
MLRRSRELFHGLGCTDLALTDDSRKLIYEDESGAYRFILAKASDVPVYVEHGVADAGIVGLDVLQEMGSDVYAPLPLGFGCCRIVVAAPRARQNLDLRLHNGVRIGTKYPQIAREHFLRKGVTVEIIPLSGSVELAPAVGLSDLLVDIVDTGRTLRENDLVEIEEIMDSQAYLIVNRASYAIKGTAVTALIEGLAPLVAGD